MGDSAGRLWWRVRFRHRRLLLLGTALDFTAKLEGRVGNKISVVAVAATEQNAQTVASLEGTTLTITLGTDEHSQVNATVDCVTEAVNALGDSPVTAAVSTPECRRL